MKLMTRGRFACAVLSWIGALALLIIAPATMAQNLPIAMAGDDFVALDTDNVGGENVTLTAAGSYDPDGYDIALYHWYRYTGHGGTISLGSSTYPELPIRLEDGSYNILLEVTDSSGETGTDTVFVTVNPPAVNQPPAVNAGPDRTVSDTDGQPGQNVLVSVDASDPEGQQLSYTWYRVVPGDAIYLSSEQNPTLSLPDGQTVLRVQVADPQGAYTEDDVVITVNPPQPPTVSAGPDRTVPDSNGVAGENVELNATGSDPDGNIVSYTWYREIGDGTETLGTGQSLLAQLPDGVSYVRVVAQDNVGLTASDLVVVTVAAPVIASSPTANAGPDRTVQDSDNAAGEDVLLDGTASTDPDNNIVSYEWVRLDGDGTVDLGTGPTLTANLPDGENVIRLIVTDATERSSSDSVIITVNAPTSNGLPTANAGADRSVADSDRTAGESVTLDGTASADPNGELINYAWSRVNGESVEELGSGSSPTLQARLPDGENTIRLVVTDNSENTASDTVVINVAAPSAVAPTANAGADRIISDTDQQQGEDVVLDGSWSVDSDGTIVDYAWSRLTADATETLGNGVSPTLQTRLNDGDSIIQLVVTDNQGNTASDTVLITVNAGTVVITTLGDLPGLTPNQKQTADALDRVCGQLRDGDGQLSTNQQDLLNRCNGLQMNNTTANQVAALDELVADDFSVARTQTLLFANTQYAGVMDRLMALRGGAKGLSLAGLNIIVDGNPVPLAQLQQMAKGLLGGGASADEPGGLLNDKWGLWARGNYSFGEKDRNTRSPGFEAEQWAMVGGVDYRYNDQIVGGVSLAYGESGIDIDGGEGGLDTTTYAMSLYGSSYVAKKFYFDAIVNVANADYGADRNIAYVDGAGLVDVDARGDTSGMTYSAGVSGGRDFLYGGLTVSPTLGLFYIDATIDSFTERGAAGLNLIYDEQSFQSFTGNLGFRVTYAWNLAWGVVMPHLRVDYVREFKNDVDVFGVRFAADPNAMSAPPILVATDNPDESYWRLATGFSTQFVDGISGYVEYQRLESFEFISFQDLSMGLRFQKSF